MAISIAVIIILGLSADYLFRKMRVPGLVGMLLAGIMLAAPRLLHISLLDAAILGSILATVSPAVVAPLMIDCMDRSREKTRTLRYSRNDPSFNDHWEVLYDW